MDPDTVTFELDVVTADDLDWRVNVPAAAGAYKLSCRLLAEEGPGGGWPLFQFTGPRDEADRFIKEWYYSGRWDETCESLEDFILPNV